MQRSFLPGTDKKYSCRHRLTALSGLYRFITETARFILSARKQTEMPLC
ncbi:hypothetical protein [Bacteroides gallinarum]|nr:hypothetical protein [Bacteroides gallinarum]